MKYDEIQLFIFTMEEYKRFYNQIPKCKITDTYDEASYVQINTKLMLLRKYGSIGENVYIKRVIERAINKYSNKEIELKKILEEYLKIETQQLEYILSDGSKQNIYDSIEDVMYGMYLHADENRIKRLMQAEENLRFVCVRKYVQELENIVFQLYNLLKNFEENLSMIKKIDKAPTIFLGDNKLNKQEIKKSTHWSNLYGKDGTLKDIDNFIEENGLESVVIIGICYSFISELKKDDISKDVLDNLIHPETKKDWGDYSEAKYLYESIENPGLSMGVEYNENHTMAYLKVLPKVDDIFVIHNTHVINEVYKIYLVKYKNQWKIYSFGGNMD